MLNKSTMSAKNPMALQAQIRQNADEVSSMLASLGKWEKNMKSKEGIRKPKVRNVASSGAEVEGSRSVRTGAGTVRTSSSGVSPTISSIASGGAKNEGAAGDGKAASAAKHTYDVGYKKWENFDVDAAMDDNDVDGAQTTEDIEEFNYDNVSSNPVVEVVQEREAKEALTPASLAMLAGSAANQVGAIQAKVPKALGVYHDKDAETAEREHGNKEFAAGQFPQAVKSYTKCLGLKKRNYIAFSNRAMAYLKMKEYIRAEVDCNSALSIEPGHVKSLVRRATARNALGKHRAALSDIYAAMEITEAANGSVKQHKVDLQKTQELLRQCVSRAPLAQIQAKIDQGELGALAGPDLPVA